MTLSYRRLIAAALLGAVAAQPDAQCNTESRALVAAGIDVSDPSCTALAAYEGCVSRIEDRRTQAALEIGLQGYQSAMQDCTAVPMTAAIRTSRDALDLSAREIVFHRTVRQSVNVHDLAAQVETNEAALATTVSTMRAETSSALAVSMSSMSSQLLAAATSAAAAMGSMNMRMSAAAAATADTVSALEARTSTQLSTSAAETSTLLATSASSASRARASLNVSVQQAIVAAANAAVPTVYVQWGTKTCTAASGAAVIKLYDGITYGSRHNYAGGGSTQLCLKNAAGDQGGVRQGGQDSNDMMVPLKRNHANYNGIPSRNNIFRAKDNWITPCAKCKYAKSCFLEVGVAECPSGFHKMYTGYMFGGHETHHGNNDRFCIDKNPANNDYTSSQNWNGYVYPTLARDGTGPGLSRNNRVALACHQCCVR